MDENKVYASVFPLHDDQYNSIYLVGYASDSSMPPCWYLDTMHAHLNRRDAEKRAAEIQSACEAREAERDRREQEPSRWRRFKMRLGIA